MQSERKPCCGVEPEGDKDLKKHKKPLNRSITIGCISFIIFLCVLLSIVNLHIYRNYVYDDYRGYISDILNLAMSQIDSEDLSKCIETGEESEKYKETLAYMDNMMDNIEDIHYLYAIKPLNTDDTGNVMSVFSAERYYDRHIDIEGNLYLGWISDDEFDSETAAKFMDIMNGDGISYFEEKTEWGTDYTGAVPIKDKSGKGIAVLAVDVDISFLQGIIREYALTNIVVIIMAGFVFIGLFLIWLNRNITRPIGQLENSAVGFAGHSHGQRDIEALSFEAPDIKRDNEIKSLSDAVVQMTENMKDYVTDILNAEQEADKQKKRATRDALTGVRNKAAYEDEIRELEEKIKDGESKYGIAVVDLNYLKTINDSYGHDKGDLAIKNLCEMICAIFKHSSVFRIGGDEFAVILQGADYDNYESLIEHFYREAELLEDNESLKPWEKVVAAVGAAFYDSASDDSIDDVFRRADQEMYICKKAMKAERAEGE